MNLCLPGWYTSLFDFVTFVWSQFFCNSARTVSFSYISHRAAYEGTSTVETQKMTRSFGTEKCCCYIRYFVISVVNKQYKTKQINSLGPEKLVCYYEVFCYIRGAFHQAFCQCFSLTTVISYWNPCIWLAESKFVSEKHWQNAWWNAPLISLYWVSTVLNYVKMSNTYM